MRDAATSPGMAMVLDRIHEAGRALVLGARPVGLLAGMLMRLQGIEMHLYDAAQRSRLPAAGTASDTAMAGLHRAIPGAYGDGHTNIACGSV